MLPYLAEFLGTALLVLLGDGCCCNVSLTKSGQKGAGTVQTGIGWGLAVMVPACIFGAASGASFNPALTISLAAIGKFDWAMVPGYVVAQMLGGFVGAILVYITFKDHFDATEDGPTKRGVFCTGPSIRNIGRNIFQEAVATFVLVFALLGFGNVKGAADAGVNYFFVWGIIAACGMCLGGLTGYAMNPARDLGPRIAHAILPIKDKADSDFSYGLVVPVFGPIIGGLVAAFLFAAIPW
ncbi:MIP/aquaporin family protein [Caproiciproducens galactitolivorans]|uniref:MIP/aquaporin family protein n=1 Tax=Caproiciproducens galactitolivorans TaxID=642589 RepID=UPI002409FC6B|nr:MIP/aquaporin family protein [Caproiciproducens galactitolivorans]